MSNIFTDNSENYDNIKFLIDDKEKIRKWLVESMEISNNVKDESFRFYLDTSAESQVTGRTVRDFKPWSQLRQYIQCSNKGQKPNESLHL